MALTFHPCPLFCLDGYFFDTSFLTAPFSRFYRRKLENATLPNTIFGVRKTYYIKVEACLKITRKYSGCQYNSAFVFNNVPVKLH